jgi:cell division protein FtsI (penicillin-binding protein 3)
VRFDTYGGKIRYSGRQCGILIREDMEKISLRFELSSNTVMVQAVYENYKNNPSKFVNHGFF